MMLGQNLMILSYSKYFGCSEEEEYENYWMKGRIKKKNSKSMGTFTCFYVTQHIIPSYGEKYSFKINLSMDVLEDHGASTIVQAYYTFL